jgi:hypothetical protein
MEATILSATERVVSWVEVVFSKFNFGIEDSLTGGDLEVISLP